MKENRSTWVLLGILIIIILVYNLYQPVNWNEDYKVENEGPYGLSILKKILPSYSTITSVIFSDEPFQNKNHTSDSLANYFLISDYLNLDTADLRALLTFVAKGNKAFIAAKELPDVLIKAILPEIFENNAYSNFVMNRLDSNMVFRLNEFSFGPSDSLVYNFYKGGIKIHHYLWSHIPSDWLSTYNVDITSLGAIYFENENLPNFVRVEYGSGAFLLHSTPLVFTNLYIIEKSKTEYVEGVFSYLNPGPIIWDNYAAQTAGPPANNQRNPEVSEQTPLKYILSQPALAWAWYLLLFMGLLYLIFRAKREQRIIPVLTPNKNTSLEYVKTVGQLYFQNGNPKQLSKQKMLYLQEHIRLRFHLQSNEWDTEFKQKLAQKSSAPNELIDKIDFIYTNIQNSEQISDNTLIKFHDLLQQFYGHCK